MRTNAEHRQLPKFYERFRELRGDMTQSDFAKKTGLSRPTIGFYENGERLPDAYKLKQIAEKCGVSADWLLGMTDVRSTDMEDRHMADELNLSTMAIDALREYKESAFAFHYQRVLDTILCDGILSRMVDSLMQAIIRFNEYNEAYPDDASNDENWFFEMQGKLGAIAEELRSTSTDKVRPFIASPAEILQGYKLTNTEMAKMLVNEIFETLMLSTHPYAQECYQDEEE